MKILVTGFTPFGGERVNPAYEAVKGLPSEIKGATVIAKEIPTEFGESKVVMARLMKTIQPDVVLCVGQAGGRAGLTFEKVAINIADGQIPDNVGYQPVDEVIEEDGETAYFTTLPVKAMAKRVKEEGISAGVSYSAGTYVCNYMMYYSLYLARKLSLNTRCGFIHVPYAVEQGVGKALNMPTMEITTMIRGLTCAIEVIASEEPESHYTGGTIA